MPFALERIGLQSQCTPVTLLHGHTLFPYATAFMGPERRVLLAKRALAADDSRISTLAHVVYRGDIERRICQECIEGELRRYGEAYWHRSHLLPGVHVCPIHGTPLLRTGTPLKGGANVADSLLPIDLPRIAIEPPLPADVLRSITAFSVAALTDRMGDANWLERFRLAAASLGYGLRRTALSSAAVATDVRQFYGDAFLEAVGCPVDSGQRTPWPGLMIRPEYPTRFVSTKYILMLAFFEHAGPVADLCRAGYRRPGPEPRNYDALDHQTRQLMAAHLRQAIRRRKRLTVKALKRASGQESSLHAFRDRFPLTRRFLKDFLASPYAARRLPPDKAGRLGCAEPAVFRRSIRRLAGATIGVPERSS